MFPTSTRGDASAGSSAQQPGAHQEGLNDGFDRLGLLSDRHRERRKPYGPTAKPFDHCVQHLSVKPVEAVRVDVVEREGCLLYTSRCV